MRHWENRLFRFCAATVLTMAGPLVLTADGQPVPLDNEIQINTFTSGDQSDPRIAARSDGAFIVVWSGASSNTDPDSAIIARQFDASGAPVADDFQVNKTKDGGQRHPNVAMAADGRFVVTWWEPTPYAFGSLYFAGRGQVHAADGVPLVTEISLQPLIRGLSMNSSASFVVSSFIDAPYGFHRTVTSVFDNLGDSTGGVDHGFDSRMWDNGARPVDDQFLVLWSPPQGNAELRLTRFDDTAQPQGELVVSSYPHHTVRNAKLAIGPDDRSLVVWTRTDLDQLLVQRYDGSGIPLGQSVVVDSGGPHDANFDGEVVAMNNAGDFLIAWRHKDLALPDPNSVEAVVFRSNGQQQGAPFRISTGFSGTASEPAIAAVGNDFIVAWASDDVIGTDTDGRSIHARRVGGIPLFIDRFESGDTLAWDATVP